MFSYASLKHLSQKINIFKNILIRLIYMNFKTFHKPHQKCIFCLYTALIITQFFWFLSYLLTVSSFNNENSKDKVFLFVALLALSITLRTSNNMLFFTLAISNIAELIDCRIPPLPLKLRSVSQSR